MTSEMTLVGHLTELRRRVLYAVIPAAVLLIPAFVYAPTLLAFLYRPALAYGYTLHLYALTDGLTLRLRASLLAALISTLPNTIAQAYIFIFPGLYSRESRALLWFTILTALLFSAGIVVFIVWLTPFVVYIWDRYDAAHVLLSAAVYYDVWEICALVCGTLCALPAGIWVLRKIGNALKS
ncbi:MAG: preprotein translocase subunit TatC [Clostridiales bacterium]|nr:preprotein translocase subunit TatC [Clostridiales bacterium]